MAIAVKAYFDCSGSSSDKNTRYLTLAGYIGTPNAWRQFEGKWAEILKRHNCQYLHMSDAYALQGEFSDKKDWTHEKVTALLVDLSNECLSETGWGQTKGEFYGVSSTVNLEDYRKACSDRPELSHQTPEEICVRSAIFPALQLLPENKSKKPFGRDGQVELFFDQGEPFRTKIEKPWQQYRNDFNSLWKFVATIAPVNMRTVIGIQAADFLAWQTNRYYTRGMKKADGALAAGFRVFASPLGEYYYDYKRLMDESL